MYTRGKRGRVFADENGNFPLTRGGCCSYYLAPFMRGNLYNNTYGSTSKVFATAGDISKLSHRANTERPYSWTLGTGL